MRTRREDLTADNFTRCKKYIIIRCRSPRFSRRSTTDRCIKLEQELPRSVLVSSDFHPRLEKRANSRLPLGSPPAASDRQETRKLRRTYVGPLFSLARSPASLSVNTLLAPPSDPARGPGGRRVVYQSRLIKLAECPVITCKRAIHQSGQNS